MKSIKKVIFTSKTFSIKPSAVRAAKRDHKASWAAEKIDIIENEEGRWFYNVFVMVNIPTKTKTIGTTNKGERDRSTVENPVALVWDMAEKMKGAKRGVVVKACIELGVNKHTARTQYQHWFTAEKIARLKREQKEAAK